MTTCVFCAIGNGELPADVVRETEHIVVFRDVNPQAPTHLLAIPRQHHTNIAALADVAPDVGAQLLAEASRAATEEGLTDGYRIVFNTGHDGGQTVDHVHAHILGGRHLSWPPG